MSTEGPTEDRYDYLVVEPPEELEEELNRMGQEGWCLAATVERDGEERFVLRRNDPPRDDRRERGRLTDRDVSPVRIRTGPGSYGVSPSSTTISLVEMWR